MQLIDVTRRRLKKLLWCLLGQVRIADSRISFCSHLGTKIITDLWKAYSGISKLRGDNGELFHTHATVNHSKIDDSITSACTNTIESRWNVAKSRSRARWGTHCTMLDSYLCEYM